ncbi:MAG: sigma 54-interacting transcriptional regulator, partial [candidate division Zixibacteria bacterium]|nr:sigma 54-interacting transcriptional regulator [candidate division Zixibacteria bacterium]
GRLTLKFTDFGFAEYEEVKDFTWWKGTLSYLAPEIIRGEKYSHQADLYSLGVLIYETLFGKRPFDEEQITDLAKSHLEKDVVIPEEPSLPAGLKNLILTLLEKDPIDRYFSAKDVLSEIERISGLRIDDLEAPLAKSLIASSDFAGRENELSVLRKAFNQASTGEGTVVLISGELGMGKTRLLQEFEAWAQVEGALVVEASLVNSESVEALQKVISHLQENISQPSVLIFEHLEVADDSALESFSDLISQTRNKKVLVCMTLTNDFTCSEKDKRASEIEQEIRSAYKDSIIQIRLEKLTEAEEKKLLFSIFAWKEKEEEIAAAVHRRTRGNPLLTEQLMEWLVSHKQIERQKGRWVVQLEQIDATPVPLGFAKEIAGRLGRLSEDELNLLSIASVSGLEFEADLLSKVSGIDPEIVIHHMENILAEQILVRSSTSPDKDKVCFLNGFTRDFIYEQIDRRKRRNFHETVGRYLEQKYATDIETHLDQLADHFYQAGDNERALKYALLAAERAEGSGRRNQAINHYLRVLELRDKCPFPLPKDKEQILESLAEQYEADGDYTKSLYYFQKALELLKGKDFDNRHVAWIYRKMARIYRKTSQHEKTIEPLHQALQLLNLEDSPQEYASVLIDLARDHRIKCEYDKAIHYLRKAISALKGQQLTKDMGNALTCMGGVHWSMGNYRLAFENLSKSLDLFQRLGEIQSTAKCYIDLSLVLKSRGLPNQALEYSRKAHAIIESFHDPYRLSILENNLALIYIDLNRWDQALECLSKSVKLKKRISDLKGLALSYNNMGLAYLRKGLFDKSVEHLATALQLFQEIRDRSGVALVYYNLGDLHRCKEKWKKASDYLEKSLRIARELGEEGRVADCLLLLGKIAMEQSNFDLSTQSLNQAAELFSKSRDRFGEAEAQLAVGELALRMGNLRRAEEHLNQIRLFIESLNNKWFDGSFRQVYAHLLKTKGEKGACLEYLLESGRIFKQLGARYELGRTYLELGRIKLEMGRIKEGKAFLCEAVNIFEKSEVEGKRKEAEVLLSQMKEMRHLDRERIQTFYKLAELLNSIWDTDELLSKALDLVIELLNAERGSVILYSETDKTFELKVSQGLEPETSQDAIAISRQVLKDVIESDSPLIVENATNDPQFARSKSVIMYNILSILCVPLRTKNRLIGTVYLDHRSLPAVFSSDDVDFLKAFASLIATAIEKSELYVKANEEIFQLKGVLHKSYQHPQTIGKSAKMQEIFNLAEKVANSKTSVLISGENGTGKELIAHLVHTRSQRRDGPFIRVNCAALPETLLESELFGIEEKIATGVGFRKGKFELADGGSIFLDEIGDMSLSVQAKVLRVLQEKEFERVGGQRLIKVDIRIISATNMDLQKKIEEGTFRKDLYYRLNPIVITIPPLRERKDDIPYLVHHFAKQFSKENNKPEIKVTKKTITALQNYSWPGNVRELEHLIESAMLLGENGKFPKELLPDEVQKGKGLVNLDKYGKLQEVLDWVEKKKITQALQRNKWNQVRAAEELGLNETSLRRRIKKHKIRKAARIKPS